ncbi:MAG: hypothetical protein ACOCP8_10060 [archaeon]
MDKKRIKRFEQIIDVDNNPLKIRLYKPGKKYSSREESEKTLKEFFEEEKKEV